MKSDKIMNGKKYMPEYIASENNCPFSPTQKTIRDTILYSNSNVLYFTTARQQGTTTMFLEDIICGLCNNTYNKILIIAHRLPLIKQKILSICTRILINPNNIIDKIDINERFDKTNISNYDYILIEDFEFLLSDFISISDIDDVIRWLECNKKSVDTKLIITSSINDNFDFRYFKYRFINNKYNVHYKIVDPQLNPEMLEYMRHMLKDEDAFRREILCKRKYEVIEEEKKPLLVEDILSMTVNEAIDYCAKNGIELKISFDKF